MYKGTLYHEKFYKTVHPEILILILRVLFLFSFISECHYCSYLFQTPKSAEEWKRVAKEFQENWNYPFCLGAIDGKHVAIKPPPNSGSVYFNYKHFFSIVLLAVVDANYKFLYVDIGAPGRSGDAGVYANSALKQALDANRLELPDEDESDEENPSCKYHLIGDDAFPLSERMMKPFSHRQLEKDKQIFNYRLSRARRVVENAFGILANRFRVFLSTIALAPEKVEIIVLAACCLHNYLVQHSVATYTSQLSSDNTGATSSLSNRFELTALQKGYQRNASWKAKYQRDGLKTYFVTDGAVPWQESMIV